MHSPNAGRFALILAACVAACGSPPAVTEAIRPSEVEQPVLGVYAHVNVTRAFGIDEYRDLARYLRTVDGVIGASPFAYQALELSVAGKQPRPANVLVKGIDPASAGSVLDLDAHLDMGGSPDVDASSLASDREMPTMFIGTSLAQELGVAVGDVVTLADSGQSAGPREFRIAGTFISGLAELDTGLVYVHLREVQRFKYGGEDIASGVDLRLAEPHASPRVQSVLRATIGAAGYTILEWQTLHAELFASMRTASTAG